MATIRMHVAVMVLAALLLPVTALAQSGPPPKPGATPPKPGSTPPKPGTTPGKAPAPAPTAVPPKTVAIPKATGPEPVAVAPAGESLAGPMNVWLKNVSPRNRSALTLWPVWCSTPALPGGGPAPLPADCWSGMPNRAAWEKWASDSGALSQALRACSDSLVLGQPYGDVVGEATWKAKGLLAMPGSADGEAAYPYLKAVRGIAAYSVIEMQRLGAAGRYDDAFTVGLDGVRMLRQAAEQRTLLEKSVAMELLCSALEAHRCFMAEHLGRMPLAALQSAALRGYPYLKQGDRDRLARLELPEGDRIVIEESLVGIFKPDGTASADLFAERLGAAQAKDAPLTRFGAAALWASTAPMHGSLEASKQRLNDAYDDWWRRWRMRSNDAMMELPTDFSRMNPARYAAVMLLAGDLQRAFELRLRAIAEINGTAVAAGLCGFWTDNGKQWPRDIGQVFPLYAVKKMDLDPYSRQYGPLEYRDVGGRTQAIDTPWGQVEATGAFLWSLGGDHEDGNFAKHDPPDGQGDLLLWPPPRYLAQKAGLTK